MAIVNESEGRKVNIEEAKQLEATGAVIWWRPNPKLPEEEQYAIVYE